MATATGDRTLECTILTPDGKLFGGTVRFVSAYALDGSLGILHGHAPLVTALGRGVLRVEDAAGTKSEWKVDGGFLEVLRNRVSVLVAKVEGA